MSSTTPGESSREHAEPVGRGADAGSDTTATRTSLAERFATAKGSTSDGSPDRTPQRSAGHPGETATRPGVREDRPAEGPSRGAMPFDEREPARPAAAPRPASPRPGPRQVRLSLARIDPWSVMKLAFLLSIAVGIGVVVAVAAMWYVLDTMHVFADVQALLDDLGSASFLNLMEYTQFDRVISVAAIIAVLDVLLLTALATLGAFLYNIVAALVGGLHVTLTDD
ncbi:DUF3566 domain-containing protein [Georgenia faecalis]|uniref:DUF3566 domain-containing protein n=1 Tax=Georgenia faecalis TaxID=2483799 RepID=UPI001F49670E|nr:DUF3566 domain-containing protein [Georgenia faecalis]